MLAVLEAAERADVAMKIFAEPVEERIAPGYYNIVLDPIDLRTIRNRVTTNLYMTYDECLLDVLRLYDNAERYNKSSRHPIRIEAQRQRAIVLASL